MFYFYRLNKYIRGFHIHQVLQYSVYVFGVKLNESKKVKSKLLSITESDGAVHSS